MAGIKSVQHSSTVLTGVATGFAGITPVNPLKSVVMTTHLQLSSDATIGSIFTRVTLNPNGQQVDIVRSSDQGSIQVGFVVREYE